MVADPEVTNRDRSGESDGRGEIAQAKPSVGIEPKKTPEGRVDPSQHDRPSTEAEKPVGDRDLVGFVASGWLLLLQILQEIAAFILKRIAVGGSGDGFVDLERFERFRCVGIGWFWGRGRWSGR